MTNVPDNEIDTQAISNAFIDARLHHKGLEKYPGIIPKTLDAAYKIQSHSIQKWNDTIVGWKVGGIAPALQDEYKTDRLVGPIFKKSVKYSDDGGHSIMPIFADGFAAIEAEFIIELGDVSSLPAEGLTQKQIQSVISRVFIGVEIASSPLKVINDIGPVGPVSDFGNNAGLIIGPQVKDWNTTDLSTYKVSVNINNKQMGTVCAPPSMKGPLGATKFLIEHLKRHNLDIPKGTYVSTGAITGVHQAYENDRSEILFHNLGSMTLKLVSGKA